MTQTGNLRHLTGDQFMLERLLETTDKEMCPAKKAGKNLVSLLETCAVTMDRSFCCEIP
jgi:hypothetical protein